MKAIPFLIALFTPGIIFADFDSKYTKALSHFKTDDFHVAEIQAEALAKDYVEGDKKNLAALLKFRALCGGGKWAEAFDAYRKIGSSGKLFDLFKEFYFINCAADLLKKEGSDHFRKNNILPAALAASVKMSENGFDQEMKDEARLIKAIFLEQAGKGKEALKELKDLLEKKRSSRDRGNIMCVMAEMSGGDEKKRLLKEIFVNYPVSECVYGTETPVALDDLTPGEQITRANRLYDAMEYSEAAKIYRGLIKKGLGGLEIVYRLGLIHLEKNRDDAKKALEYFLNTYKVGKYREDSLYRIARSYAKLDNYETALKYYQKYLKDFPKGKYREAAYYYLGWLPFDHGEYAKAIQGFDLYLKRIKKGKRRSYIIWFRAWSFYKMGNYEEAIKAFDMLLPFGNPLVAGKGLYWSGMALKKLNKDAEAAEKMKEVIKRYPLTYYAVLAAKRLNDWNGEKLPEWITGESPLKDYPAEFWGFEKIRNKNILKSLKQVKLLVDLGEERRARILYNKSCRDAERFFKGAEKALFLLTTYTAIGENHKLFIRSQKEFGRAMGSVPDEKSALYWLLAYPAAERKIAKVVAQRFEIPELWIYSIMRQESRYRHYQVSHADALGLMQVIPQTAKIIGERLGVKFDAKKFFDPGKNLLFAGYYLSLLLKEFRNQIIFASAAYNAGSPPIQKFLEKNRGADFDEMVEEIAYNEARNYCRKVAEHLVRYGYLHLAPLERAKIYQMLFPDKVNYDYLKETNF